MTSCRFCAVKVSGKGAWQAVSNNKAKRAGRFMVFSAVKNERNIAHRPKRQPEKKQQKTFDLGWSNVSNKIDVAQANDQKCA